MIHPVFSNADAFSLEALLNAFPKCKCGGMTRPDFVSFGEAVQDLPEAKVAAQSCDVMLVVGPPVWSIRRLFCLKSPKPPVHAS